MGYSVYPAPSAGGKIQKKITLTSGTSWTVPTGVTDINVLLVGGGGGSSGAVAGSGTAASGTGHGNPGNTVWSTLTTTPGSSITYAIGAGGSAGSPNYPGSGGDGGNTTFTGATTANGGLGGKGTASGATASVSFATNGGLSPNSGLNQNYSGSAGGAGFIEIEYWV